MISERIVNSDDISALLTLALENLDYDNESIVRYSFLIEEALLKWNESGLSEQELCFSRNDTRNDVRFTWQVRGESCDPFAIDLSTSDVDYITRMKDLLLSGVGNELKYKYKHGVNTITLSLPKKDHAGNLFKSNLKILAIPLCMQALMTAIATYVDSFMMGFLDVSAMSAVSQLSPYINTLSGILMACEIAATVVITKLWGKRDRQQMQYAQSIVMQLSLLISLVFWAGAFFAPRSIMSFYTDIPDLITYGVPYLRTVSFSFLITAAYRMYYCFMRIIGKAKACMLFSIYACILNVICNSIFIFGLFGIPKMGAHGAALSTTLSGLLQLILVIIYANKDKALHIDWIFTKYRHPVVMNYLTTVAPIFIQFAAWLIASNIIASAFGHMNADILAAYSILLIITSLTDCMNVGISTSGSVLIGNLLGKKKTERAWMGSRVLIKVSAKAALISILTMVLFCFVYTKLPVDLSEEAIRYLIYLNVIYAINTIFAYLNCAINKGTLYAGGEAKKILFIDTIVMWGIMVPVALASTYWVTIPALLLFFILKFDETLSFPYKFYRYRRKEWLTSKQ